MSATLPRPNRRRYDATGRRAQAQRSRERVLREASRLVIEQGFAATTVAQIAAAAGVSPPTVFARFGSKVNLLKEAIDIAIVGDVEPIPLADRPSLQRVHQGRTAQAVLERYADVCAEVATRAFPIYAVAYAAADADPQVAALVADLDRQRLTGAAAIAATVADRQGVTDPRRVDDLRDTIWVLNSPLQYRLMVQQRGWPIERYRDWIATALVALTAA
jgi:AcrR family transcriptional regulator